MTIAAKFLEVQNELNLKLSQEWFNKGWAYPDAMFTEATEAYNHLNWEWWRATDRVVDWDQVKLEWVDVGHFLFSEVVARGYQTEFKQAVASCAELPKPSAEIDVSSLKELVKGFIYQVLNYDAVRDEYKGSDNAWDMSVQAFEGVLSYFFGTVHELGLTIEQYYTLFIGKVCLNQLRWKNGYKKGIYESSIEPKPEFYIKTWDGEEDNVWLANAAGNMNSAHPDFKADLERILDGKYKQVYEAVWNK